MLFKFFSSKKYWDVSKFSFCKRFALLTFFAVLLRRNLSTFNWYLLLFVSSVFPASAPKKILRFFNLVIFYFKFLPFHYFYILTLSMSIFGILSYFIRSHIHISKCFLHVVIFLHVVCGLFCTFLKSAFSVKKSMHFDGFKSVYFRLKYSTIYASLFSKLLFSSFHF